jgi:hypothetical protein
LLRVNQELLDTFLSYAEFDEAYRERFAQGLKLDYLAFCHVGDGNYLAFNLGETDDKSIFFLDHEYGAYPYADEHTREAYIQVAASLEEWLDKLIESKGWNGTGGKLIPL